MLLFMHKATVAGFALLQAGYAARSTVTVTLATGTCPASELLPPSKTVVLYSTTDAAGSYYLTSTIEGLSESFYTYSTTNSAGSTVLTLGSSAVLEPLGTSTPGTPLGSITSYATTDPVGSTVEVTSAIPDTAATGGATVTSGSSSQATGRSPCPAALAESYTASDGTDWQLVCNSVIYYSDLPATNTSSLAACISACDSYTPVADNPIYGGKSCVAVTYTDQNADAANCFLHYDILQVVYGSSPFDSAKRADFGLSPSLSVSVVSSIAQPTGTEGTVATSTSPVPTYSSYEPVTPCPIANNTYFTYPDGDDVVYYVQCGVSYLYNDLPSLVTDSFESCIAACDSWVPAVGYGVSYNEPCIAVTYTTYDPNNPSFMNCYRHSAVTNSRYGGDPYGNGAVRVEGVPSQSVSTGTLEPTPIANSGTAASTSGGGSGGSATSNTAGTASTGGSLSAGTISGAVQGGSTSSSEGNSPTAVTGTSATASTEGSTGGTSGLGSSTSAVAPATPSTSTGADSPQPGYLSSAAGAAPCPCPSANGTYITTSDSTKPQQYGISCDTVPWYGDEPGTYIADSLEDCFQSCDEYNPPQGNGITGNTPCVAVRYAGPAKSGQNCFRMSTTPGQPYKNLTADPGSCGAYASSAYASSASQSRHGKNIQPHKRRAFM